MSPQIPATIPSASRCRECNGYGVIWQGLPSELRRRDSINCTACRGTGRAIERMACPVCDGSGSPWDGEEHPIQCPTCAGSGFLDRDDHDVLIASMSRPPAPVSGDSLTDQIEALGVTIARMRAEAETRIADLEETLARLRGKANGG